MSLSSTDEPGQNPARKHDVSSLNWPRGAWRQSWEHWKRKPRDCGRCMQSSFSNEASGAIKTETSLLKLKLSDCFREAEVSSGAPTIRSRSRPKTTCHLHSISCCLMKSEMTSPRMMVMTPHSSYTAAQSDQPWCLHKDQEPKRPFCSRCWKNPP